MTFFNALNWQPLLEVAGSQAGGQLRLWVPRCPLPSLPSKTRS
jgi:hypothetical protein